MTHEERVWHHEMETLEGIHEHAERIASLEELVLDMWALVHYRCSECEEWWRLGTYAGACRLDSCKRWDEVPARMAALGLEPE